MNGDHDVNKHLVAIQVSATYLAFIVPFFEFPHPDSYRDSLFLVLSFAFNLQTRCFSGFPYRITR
jgi:hypothetical protein